MRLSVLSRNRREEIIPMRCGFNKGGGALRFCVTTHIDRYRVFLRRRRKRLEGRL